MSAQTEIRDRILGDLKDDKILQNVTLERLWYYFELIGDITGGGGSGFTYGAGEPSGGADGDYYIRTDATQIWYNNGGTWEVTLSLTPLQITGDQFAALIATPADIIQGQVYRVVPVGGDAFALPLSIGDMYITGGNGVFLAGALANVTLTGRYEFVTYYTSDNTVFQNSISTLTVDLAQAYFSGSDIQNSSVIVNTDYVIISGITPVLPTGISRIKGKAVLDPSGNVVWDKGNCEAWVTALGLYLPCTYDVGTNTISGKYVIWAGNISQSSGADATIDYTSVNLLGEVPVFDATSTGTIEIQNTLFSFPQYKTILFSPHVFITPNIWAPSMEWVGAHVLSLYMVKGDGSLADDIYNNTYIEISILF